VKDKTPTDLTNTIREPQSLFCDFTESPTFLHSLTYVLQACVSCQKSIQPKKAVERFHALAVGWRTESPAVLDILSGVDRFFEQTTALKQLIRQIAILLQLPQSRD
jgi:hypothetical protein